MKAISKRVENNEEYCKYTRVYLRYTPVYYKYTCVYVVIRASIATYTRRILSMYTPKSLRMKKSPSYKIPQKIWQKEPITLKVGEGYAIDSTPLHCDGGRGVDGRCMFFAVIGEQEYDYEHTPPVYGSPWVDEPLSPTQEVLGVGDTTRKCGGAH